MVSLVQFPGGLHLGGQPATLSFAVGFDCPVQIGRSIPASLRVQDGELVLPRLLLGNIVSLFVVHLGSVKLCRTGGVVLVGLERFLV